MNIAVIELTKIKQILMGTFANIMTKMTCMSVQAMNIRTGQ